jgi:membrane-associated phospholipid phosphatase
MNATQQLLRSRGYLTVTSRKSAIARIMEIWLIVAIMATLYPNTSLAQSAEDKESAESFNSGSLGKVEETNEIKFNKDYWKGYISDTKYILTSPLRWEKSDWLKFSLVAGTTIGLFALDHEIQHWAQERRNSTTNSVSGFFEPFGSGAVGLPVLGAFYLYGHFSEDKKAQATGLLCLESVVISEAFVQAIKVTTHRQRPDEGGQSDKWYGPSLSFTGSHLSFPSGDSALAFSIGTVIASQYQDTSWVPPLCYGIATLVGLGRINDNDHWASDVFFGSAVGFFTAKAIVGLHKNNPNIVIMPVIDGQARGLALSLIF